MIGRRGRWNWYDALFLILALAIVYPDRILDWLSEKTGRVWDGRHLVVFEVLAIGVTVAAACLLMPHYPKLQWWYPILFVGLISLFRLLHWLLVKLFGFDV